MMRLNKCRTTLQIDVDALRSNVDLIAAFTDFLCKRYNDRYAGTISGIILGITCI